MEKCRYLDGMGNCTKYKLIKTSTCKPSDISYCDEPVDIVDPSRMCEYSSPFGNDYVYITEEQIDQLKSGKVLGIDVNSGEYCVFVAFRKE